MAALKTVVFPVAGFGTRMLPATRSLPKEMLPVVDKPVVQYALEEAAAAGAEKFIFVTGRGKAIMEDHFDHAFELMQTLQAKGKTEAYQALEGETREPGEVIYVRQQQAKGLGHAVWCARHLINEDHFGVMLVDDLIHSDTSCMEQLRVAHEKSNGNAVAVMTVPEEQTSRYGIIAPGDRDGNRVDIRGIVEKPQPAEAPSRMAVVGRYVLSTKIFDYLNKHQIGAGGEIQLTDAMQRLIGIQPFQAVLFEGKRFDCGDKLGYLEAIIETALMRDELRQGVQDIIAKFK